MLGVECSMCYARVGCWMLCVCVCVCNCIYYCFSTGYRVCMFHDYVSYYTLIFVSLQSYNSLCKPSICDL